MHAKHHRLVRLSALFRIYHIPSNVKCVNEDALYPNYWPRYKKKIIVCTEARACNMLRIYQFVPNPLPTFILFLDDVQIRPISYHHNGFTSKRNPRIFRLSRGQFTCITIFASIHSRKCKSMDFCCSNSRWWRRVLLIICVNYVYFDTQIPDYRNSVIVARNPGSAKKATSYAERLRLGIAVIHGEQKESESDEIDGRNSPPISSR